MIMGQPFFVPVGENGPLGEGARFVDKPSNFKEK